MRDTRHLKASAIQCHNDHGRLVSRSVRGRGGPDRESSCCFWPEDIHFCRRRIAQLFRAQGLRQRRTQPEQATLTALLLSNSIDGR
jgi:hypothetical protein